MGMFDSINFKTVCPTCGEPMEDFQSKDGPCAMNKLEITEVDYFYCSCDGCRTWVDYKRKEGKKDSHQTLLEAKKLISEVLSNIKHAYEYVDIAEEHDKLENFLKEHPLPQNSIDDFEMTFQTKQEKDAAFDKFEEEFYEKHGKEWYEFVPTNVKSLEDQILELPKAKPNVFIDPDLVDDEDEKD